MQARREGINEEWLGMNRSLKILSTLEEVRLSTRTIRLEVIADFIGKPAFGPIVRCDCEVVAGVIQICDGDGGGS
jgi:hypothetical protein